MHFKRFQKLILISVHVIYIILSPWIEIRPLSLTSNPSYKCLRNYILPPAPTLRFGLSSGPPINLTHLLYSKTFSFVLNTHVFDYPHSRLPGPFSPVPPIPDNRARFGCNII